MALADSRYLLHNGTGKGQSVWELEGGKGVLFPNRLSAGADAYGTLLKGQWMYCFAGAKWGWIDISKVGFSYADRGGPPVEPPIDPNPVPVPNPLIEQLIVDMMENHVVAITFKGVRIFP